MKITVKEGGGAKISFAVPSWIALRILLKACGKYIGDVKELRKISKALKSVKKQWRGLKIAEITSSDGEEVIITI